MSMDLRQIIARAINSWAKRNLWQAFNYPATVQLDDYWRRYRRDGIGSRVVRAYPDACWRTLPTIEDGQGTSSDPADAEFSAFAAAFEQLAEEHNLIGYLRRLDRLSRVGHYAVMVFGFAGQDELNTPFTGSGDLMYLSVYSERAAKIAKFDEDPKSPRYGLPEAYTITPSRDSQSAARSQASFEVHWTRVLHVAENLDEDEVFGEPAMRPIWNYLLDLEKVAGAGAETFWLNARGGLSVEAHPDAKLGDKTIEDMKKQLEDYGNELRRTLAMAGAKVSAIATTVSDPKPNAELALQLICGTTGIPTRILTGSERGELASSQDANSWEGRVDERCNLHCNPYIMRPFVQRMIEAGVLPEPVKYWVAEWPAANTLTDLQRAELAVKKVEAAGAWANGMADRAMSLEEFRPLIDLAPTSEYDLADDTPPPKSDEDTLGDDLNDDEDTEDDADS